MRKSNDKLRILLKRSLVMFSVNIFLLFVLVGRLYYLQVYQGEKYALLADSNRFSTRLLVPPRGSINDRNGIELATNIQNFQAMLIAEQVRGSIDTCCRKFRRFSRCRPKMSPVSAKISRGTDALPRSKSKTT